MVYRTVLAALLLVLAPAASAQSVGDAYMHEVAAGLRPGQFAWIDEAPDGPVEVVVSLVLQRAYVYRAGLLIGVAAVSTGRRGKGTPAGVFPILQKNRWHRSNIYSNAPMPFMQRLTWTGIALHAGVNPGYPASHGCIRLPTAFARDLFGLTALGTPVTVAAYPGQLPVYLEVEGVAAPAVTFRLDYAPSVFAAQRR